MVVTHNHDKVPQLWEVTIHPTHYGHPIAAHRVRLPQLQRKLLIEEPIARGVPVERVKLDISKLPPSHQAIKSRTMKTLHNVLQKEKMKNRPVHGRFHEVDQISCEVRFKTDLSKKRGFFSHNFDEISSLEDVELVIITKKMGEWAKRFAHNTILVDSTFGVTKKLYGLKLTTVMVINEFGMGLPIAYFISKKMNSLMWENCLHVFRLMMGKSVKPKIFMSDDDPSYYHAWRAVMGKPTKKLLCTWHVAKSWERKAKKLFGKEKSHFIKLLEVKDEISKERFEKKVKKISKMWLNGTSQEKEYFEYFNKFYYSRKEEWANCFRIKAGVTTNNYVEASFGSLKRSLRLTKGKRLDELLNQILIKTDEINSKYINKVARNELFKEEATRKKHNIGAKMELKFHRGDTYTLADDEKVTKASDCYKCNCINRCKYCNVCFRQFECTCSSFQVSAEICSHIHAVAIKIGVKKKFTAPKHQIVSPPASETDECDTVKKINEMTALLETMKRCVIDEGKMKDIQKSYNIIRKAAHELHRVNGNIYNDVPENAEPRTQNRF